MQSCRCEQFLESIHRKRFFGPYSNQNKYNEKLCMFERLDLTESVIIPGKHCLHKNVWPF